MPTFVQHRLAALIRAFAPAITAPGHCLTPMPLQFDSPETIARKTETIPLKRYGQPEDMGHAISYLASPQASFVTGQVISPNGGFQMT